MVSLKEIAIRIGPSHCDERAQQEHVTIWTARPGIVIGRKGQELDLCGLTK